MPPVLEYEKDTPQDADQASEEFKHLTLGSRKNLCINPKVNKLASATAINERCLELQQSKTSPDHTCPYLPNKENKALVNEFRDHALAKIRDIEDLGEVGQKIGICPYYATRAAVRPSEIVTLPYPLLLQKAARQALDISLQNHVIIIDEAHNLMDAIASMYSATISLKQLKLGRSQLMMYLQKFRNRLKGKNRVYVTQIVRVIDSLVNYLKGSHTTSKQLNGVIAVADLMAGKGVDQINLFKLSKYITDSRLARKVDSYIDFMEDQATKAYAAQSMGKKPQQPLEASTPVLTLIENFLMALMNPSKEGRFFCYQGEDSQGIGLQYMLLDPTFHFREIVDEARAVILAGGTMSPMDDYIKHLFSYVPKDRIMTLSCDHVIPPTNLLAWSIAQDSKGNEFNFTFQSRNSSATTQSAGQTLLELIREIPDGVVAFFSSYAYLDTCVRAWKQITMGTRSLWDELNSVKPIFLEPRSSSDTTSKPIKTGPAATEALLTSYATTINESNIHRGALLLSVVNGSLSEGINFSDALGRAVIVFGLPFPNAHSPEWKAKMEYIASKEGTPAAGKAAAQEFYENATMRAVNQAVGRAIRHKGDHASIYLIDRRYCGERIRGKLPGWIKGSLRGAKGMSEVVEGTKEFFERKKAT
jgi:chromosome transmission fidelity protein 1